MFINILLSLLLINSTNGIYQIENEPFLHLNENSVYEENIPQRVNLENVGVKITADKYLVLDVDSGKVLMEQNSNIRQPIASITKMMTALVILDQAPDWDFRVTLLKADETVGAKPHIYRGETVSFLDLWKAGLISSDNNSIMAMVRSLGLDKDEFVDLMNNKAEELEMFNTTFDDPTGLSEKNLSTATDVARLIYYALQKEEIRQTVIEDVYSFSILNNTKIRNIETTDILINSFLNSEEYGYNLVGGKTGYLTEAGYCLSVEIEKNGHSVIFVVLNSEDINARFQDTKVLADWVFNNYKWKE